MIQSDLLGNLSQATPARGASLLEETLPASETQVLASLKGSPSNASPGSEHGSCGKPGTPCPTSPSSSVPSSAGQDEAIWFQFMNVAELFRLNVYVFQENP